MTAEGLVQAVRGQLGLGRLLPLGGPDDAAWIAERAAAGVLAGVERAVPGVRIDRLRIALAEPDAHDWGAVRAANPAAPPSALPAGPLRIEADFQARGDRPLPRTAEALRAALAGAAADRIGLRVAEVDLRVVGLLEDSPPGTGTAALTASAAADGAADEEDEEGHESDEEADGDPAAARDGRPDEADRARDAALAVPGVARAAARATGAAVRVRLTVDAGHRALDVARAVRRATGAGAVVVTAVR